MEKKYNVFLFFENLRKNLIEDRQIPEKRVGKF